MFLTYLFKLSPKKLAGILVLISLSIYIHLWYVYSVLGFANDVGNFLAIARKNTSFSSTKYILLWSDYYLALKKGKSIFPSLNCAVSNCIFTKDKALLNGDYRNFDAVMFYDGFLTLEQTTVPKYRSEGQLYIFTSIESPFNKPACDLHNDDFYNWTFTYRLSSTVVWKYFVVRNSSGHIVAPSKDVVWRMNTTAPVPKDVKKILLGKTKAAVWLVSHCRAQSFRDEYLSDLQEHLYHYSLSIDVFGACTRKNCKGPACNAKIKDNYYFYMAFENAISEDYVSEKVLHGYDNYAIPIVYGGANYTRFLPQGSYINARDMHPYMLASKMKQIIDDSELHESYFTWRNSYTISAYENNFCDLCAALNQPHKKTTAIKKFRLWWNGGPDGMKWCLSSEFWNESQKVNYDLPYVNTFNSVKPMGLR